MAQRKRQPRRLRKAVLTMIALYGGTAAVSCCPPVVCDPAPPPSSAPRPTDTPMIFDPPPPPSVTALPPTSTPLELTPTLTPTETLAPGASPTPMICDPAPAAAPGVPLAGSGDLPLAEIRTANIRHLGNLAFAAESPWPGARWRWTASGGELAEAGEGVAWQPPTVPGRYLLQVVADWGRAGLAVDALVLTVGEDGHVSIA